MVESRFKLGKYDVTESDFAGRRIRLSPDRIAVIMDKYSSEEMHTIPLARGRRGDKDSKLRPEEFDALRSLIYKCNWVGREARPEARATASILASRLPQATVQYIATVNATVNYLRATAARPLTVWVMDPRGLVFAPMSDAGGIGSLGHELDCTRGPGWWSVQRSPWTSSAP